jgi:hypothetical protein
LPVRTDISNRAALIYVFRRKIYASSDEQTLPRAGLVSGDLSTLEIHPSEIVASRHELAILDASKMAGH